MEPVKKTPASQILTALFTVTVVGAIAVSFYHYFYKKNYDYLVESACDPTVEVCFIRDCNEADACPPNGLAIYKQYQIRASDFKGCTDNSCLHECESGAVKCVPIACDSTGGDECTEISNI